MEKNEFHQNDSSCCSVECKGKIIETETLSECQNVPVLKTGVAKVPVVLAEFTVQIDIESKIKLAEQALEIKRIIKNVFLTQCKLIDRTNKVFLKGFVRKNIEYATVDCVSKTAICGDIKHLTVHVPFQCMTEVEDLRHVDSNFNPTTETISFFDDKNIGTDLKEKDLISEEFFNEKVYCELISVRIFEADIVEECEKVEFHPMEHVFETFIEKEVIYLTIKLLQNQQKGKSGPICNNHCS